tara:strand:+ start:294 stop:452 length:159 start_codon:yes stop_codon:yes gene_type:complete
MLREMYILCDRTGKPGSKRNAVFYEIFTEMVRVAVVVNGVYQHNTIELFSSL